ncbi:hypothetical protein HDU97_003503 [Phlyctochytrium planicorne]|nr:hypothetical protein HDU97_003503 [Phlyctochytrium planicorne]
MKADDPKLTKFAARLKSERAEESRRREKEVDRESLLRQTPPPPKPFLTGINLTSLWHLSLTNISVSPHLHSIKSLGTLAALNLLDLSYTDIDLLTLQHAIRPMIALVRLHLFGCNSLFKGGRSISSGFVPAGAPGSIGSAVERPGTANCVLDEEEIREWEENEEIVGFIQAVLPNVWMLNGVMVTVIERRRWSEHYLSREGRGRFSVLVRKLLVPFRRSGKASIGEGMEKSVIIQSVQNNPKEWNDHSKELLQGMPTHFNMGADEDWMKIRRMGKLLCRDVADHLSKTVDRDLRPILEPFFVHMLDPNFAVPVTRLQAGKGRGLQECTVRRISIFMFIYASLFSGIPKTIVQAALEDTFSPQIAHPQVGKFLDERSEDGYMEWTNRLCSPIYWRYQDRLLFLGLLSAVLLSDLQFENAAHSVALEPKPQNLLKRILFIPSAITKIHIRTYSNVFTSSEISREPFDWVTIPLDFENTLSVDTTGPTPPKPISQDKDLADSLFDISVESIRIVDPKPNDIKVKPIPLFLVESMLFMVMNVSFRESSVAAFASSLSQLLLMVDDCIDALEINDLDEPPKWLPMLSSLQNNCTHIQQELVYHIKIDRKIRKQQQSEQVLPAGLSVDGKILEARAKLAMALDAILSHFIYIH